MLPYLRLVPSPLSAGLALPMMSRLALPCRLTLIGPTSHPICCLSRPAPSPLLTPLHLLLVPSYLSPPIFPSHHPPVVPSQHTPSRTAACPSSARPVTCLAPSHAHPTACPVDQHSPEKKKSMEKQQRQQIKQQNRTRRTLLFFAKGRTNTTIKRSYRGAPPGCSSRPSPSCPVPSLTPSRVSTPAACPVLSFPAAP